MRLYWCAECHKTTKFSPTDEYDTVDGKKFRVYTCDTCMYRLHVEVAGA